jgi:predicted dehydrogenase
MAEVAAICDKDPGAVERAKKLVPNAATYDAYDELLDHELDAVVLCNYCPDHAPAAVRAMEAGKNVLSEVTACHTLAEGVELARTVERTGRTYMLAENYCYMCAPQEMRRIYESGGLGVFRYGEGEYVHFSRDIMHRVVDLGIEDHWRLWLPATYYCTHSLGPLLRITGLKPIEVSGAAVPSTKEGWTDGWHSDYGLELVRLENGALAKSLHGGGCPREPWSPWWVIYGTKGVIENRRWPKAEQLTLYLDGDDAPTTYTPEFRTLREAAARSGHWGGDIFVMYEFLNSIRSGSKPDIDVYMALEMTIPGILAWRSAIDNGRVFRVPDMRSERDRLAYQDDHLSPRPGTPEEYLLPHVLGGRSEPPEDLIERMREKQESEPY